MILGSTGASSTSKTLQSTVSSLHMGLDGYVWWIGVVENRKDPLGLGRAQVRIYSWHTDDKAAMPTESLPWAQAIQPINGTHGNIVPPKEGTTVLGFFMDGKEGQFPIMTGILNGVPTTKNPSSKGFSDPGSDLDSRPKPPGKSPTTYPAKVGQPTSPDLARNEFVSGANTYLGFKELTRVTVTTATSIIPDVENIAKSFTLPTLSSLDVPQLSELTDSIDGFIDSTVAGITSEISGVIEGVQGEINAATSKLSKSLDAIKEIGNKLESSLENLIDSSVGSVLGEVNSSLDSLQDSIVGSALGEGVQNAVSDLTGGIEGTLNNLSKTISGEIQGTESITSLLGSAGEDLLGEAKAALEGIDSEILSAVTDLKLASVLTAPPPESEPTWEEPASPYNAKYPYNSVTQTESGHVIEVDDTPGAERIHTRHRTGTYDEMQPDGSRVTHIFGNHYHIVAKDENITISGVCNITINGDANLYVKSNLRSVVDGDAVMEFKKNLKMVIGENLILENGKDFVQKSKGNMFIDNGKDFIHGSAGKQTWSTTGDQSWTTAGNQTWSGAKYDFK